MGHDSRMPAVRELVSRSRIFITIRVIPRAELAARLGLPSVAIMRAAVEKLKLWDNGSTLRVTFLDGDPAGRRR